VDDATVAAEVAAIAAREREVPERVRGFYERPEARAALHARLVRERALAHVMSLAKIVPLGDEEDVARAR